ncbi:hypothetical protein B0H14DRAFT_2747747 [Mycena olivaceomarginata]|nr:hypothetical protein B0H14DRAFT_2747747 [Mycena olivaceomarginata]
MFFPEISHLMVAGLGALCLVWSTTMFIIAIVFLLKFYSTISIGLMGAIFANEVVYLVLVLASCFGTCAALTKVEVVGTQHLYISRV